MAAAGFRSSTGALLEPLESEFGWSRATTSGAVTANLVIYGLTAPFAAALMERFGLRRVVCLALCCSWRIGSGLTTVMTAPWQLWLLWGVSSASAPGAMALVLGAIVANRWFVESRRGLVTGVFSAAGAAGQLVFLPGIAALADRARAGAGPRSSSPARRCCSCRWCCSSSATDPADLGLRPLGAQPG